MIDNSLRPEIKRSIFFKNYDNGKVAIVDSESNNALGSVEQDELRLISYCTGKIDIATIINKNPEYEKEDILEFLNDLFENNILYFK